VFCVLLALSIHQFIVYSLAVRFLGNMKPLFFFRGIQDAVVTAFSTASSNATLPTSLKVAEEKLHLPPHISRFVLTIGSTLNQNGTALFEGVTVLFLAQFYDVPLSIGPTGDRGFYLHSRRYRHRRHSCRIDSGRCDDSRAGGCSHRRHRYHSRVDRFLDMCRTVLNVTGDLAAAVVVSRGEKPS